MSLNRVVHFPGQFGKTGATDSFIYLCLARRAQGCPCGPGNQVEAGMRQGSFLRLQSRPACPRAAHDTTYFLSPAAIPSWIWELFPQMVDSLKKIFKKLESSPATFAP